MRLRVLLSSSVWGQRDSRLYYADAWAFVHFGLLSQTLGGPDRRKEFATFVSGVSQGNPWELAFLAAFEASPEEVEKEFRRHRSKLAQMEVLTLENITVDLDESAIVFESVESVEIAHELARLGIDGFDAGWESAGQLFDLILETSPHDATALWGRIRVAAHGDDLDFGDALWGRLREDQRRGVAAWQAEADLCRAHARSLDPDEHEALFAEVIECAVSGYGRVIAEAPDRVPALAGMGKTLVLAEHEDPASGISALKHAVVLSPDSPGLRLDLAELLIRSGETSAALPHLDYVVETYPGSRFAKRARNLRRKAG